MVNFTDRVSSKNTPLKVSLCTVCMGRLAHLQQTLAKNISAFKDDPNVEFCVMAYGDEETAKTIEAWAKSKHRDLVEAGRIRLGYTEAENYHSSHAKNLAHLLSSPDSDVVCNIDADNFASKEYVAKVREVFRRPGKIYLQKEHLFRPPEEAGKNMKTNGEERLGHMGRLAMRRNDFLQFGYEERIEGWGGEDTLLPDHMGTQGFRQVMLDEALIGETIPHNDRERIRHMSEKAKRASQKRLSGMNFPLIENFPTANPNGFGHAEVDVRLGKNGGKQFFGIMPEQQKHCATR